MVPFVVIVEKADDIEHLRTMAYAAANQRGLATTEHWDEPRSSDVAFCFKAFEAWFVFVLNHICREEISLIVSNEVPTRPRSL